MSEKWDKESILKLSGAFQTCRILLTAAELDLFTILSDGPKSVEDIARDKSWDERGLRIVMDALAATGFLQKTAEAGYSVDESVLKLMSKNGRQSILPLVLHRNRMWESWSKLTEIVKTGSNPNPLGMASRTSEEVQDFIDAMHVVGSVMANRIVESLDLTPFKRMLDVGGASGTYIMAFLRKAPHLKATLFDFPRVIEMGRNRLTENGFIDRVEIVGGDYTNDELPGGHDLVLLSAIIHSNSREVNRMLYSKILRSLDPGGTVLIRDYVLDDSRTNPPDGAIFAVNMLCATSAGDSYTFKEIREDLEAAGFINVDLIRNGANMDQLVTAEKPR
jgi:SAM-dependent methyltransferase